MMPVHISQLVYANSDESFMQAAIRIQQLEFTDYTHRERCPDGQLVEEYSSQNDIINYRTWYPDGTLNKACCLVKNTDIVLRVWNQHGEFDEEYVYSQDTKQIRYRSWHDADHLKREYTILNGHLDGLYLQWYKCGQLQFKRTYNNGKVNGRWHVWYANGRLKEQCHFDNDVSNGHYQTWYESGRINVSCCYINGRHSGLYRKCFDADDRKEEEFYCDNGKMNGLYTTWWSNGQKKKECRYLGGKLHGILKMWRENGYQWRSCVYANGELLDDETVNVEQWRQHVADPTDDCSICQDALSADQYVLPCGHRFHGQAAECTGGKTLADWFIQKPSCPNCCRRY